MGAVIPGIIGAAASIGGGLLKSNAEQNAIDTQNMITQRAQAQATQVRQQEQQRQQQLQQQALQAQQAQVGQNTVGNVQNQITQQEQQAAQPAQTIASSIAAMSPSETALPSSANDPSNVNADLSKRLALSADLVRKYAAPKSNLQAVGTVFGNIARQYNNTGDYLGMINNQRNSSLQTAQGEMGLVGNPYGVNDIKPNLAYADLASGLGTDISKAYAQANY
jgi:hypothetical protein